MPELPEVETVRRGLAAVWEGQRFAHVEARRPDLRIPLPVGFAKALTGRRVLSVGRRAKYLVVRLEAGLVLLGHLGMSGRMVIGPIVNTPPGKHDHVVFDTDQCVRVTYTDPRRFGLFDFAEQEALDAHPLLKHLGPEPLGDAFTAAVLEKGLAGRRGPIKPALLDQRLVVGVGNIYACEALFRARIDPTRPAGGLTRKELARLTEAIKQVLAEAIEAGGSTLRDHVQPSGELGYFQHGFAVYDREGQPCPGCDCAKGVARLVQAGRSTFYCAKRQK